MNAMVGNPGGYLKYGQNVNNPAGKQFIRMGDIPDPARIFVFIEEHPNSINDGYFLYRRDEFPSLWYDLPASYHYGGANISFADVHIEYRKWVSPGTIQPPVQNAVSLPMPVPVDNTSDYDWLMEHATVVSY